MYVTNMLNNGSECHDGHASLLLQLGNLKAFLQAVFPKAMHLLRLVLMAHLHSQWKLWSRIRSSLLLQHLINMVEVVKMFLCGCSIANLSRLLNT